MLEDKRRSPINKIIGAGPTAKKQELGFHQQNFLQELDIPQIEKPENFSDILDKINAAMGPFLEQFNCQWVEIPPSCIIFPDLDKLDKETKDQFFSEKDESFDGLYSPVHQKIFILRNELLEYSDSMTILYFLINTLVHEILHANSFSSVEISRKKKAAAFAALEVFSKDENGNRSETPETAYTSIRRIGFNIIDKNSEIKFQDIDEAIISQLQIFFLQKEAGKIGLPSLENMWDTEGKKIVEYMRKTYESSPKIKELFYFSEFDEEGFKSGKIFFPYKKEREKLWDLINGLYEKNEDEFADKMEVFNLFAQACLNGNLLPVARLIEKTCGKGSFRILGNGQQPNQNVRT